MGGAEEPAQPSFAAGRLGVKNDVTERARADGEEAIFTFDAAGERLQFRLKMSKKKDKMIEVACPDCGAMLRIDGVTGLVVSHTPAPRKRMFEDLETAAQAMREQGERAESIFRQSLDTEKNKKDLLEKKFADALRKAKDAPEGKPFREIDLD